MLKKYQHDPHVLQRVSKHFFCENVYDDDSTDRPKSKWRIRNLFEEDLASAHMTYDDDSYNKKINSVKTDLRKTHLQRKQTNVSMPLLPLNNLKYESENSTGGTSDICYTRIYLLEYGLDNRILRTRLYKLLKKVKFSENIL